MPDASENEIEGFLRSHGPFEPPPRHSCGARIGDWKVLAFLGRGGSSEVYRAENTVTGLVAALKILYRSDDSARERFRREVSLVAKMRSAAFPKFYGAGECDGQFYLADAFRSPVLELGRNLCINLGEMIENADQPLLDLRAVLFRHGQIS